MAQKPKTAAKTAPRKIELPPRTAADSVPPKVESAAATGTVNGSHARVRDAQAAASAGIVAKRQERRAPPAAKAVSTVSVDFDDLAAVGQENLEACLKCGTIVVKGMELLGKEVATFAQTAVEANLTVARNVLAAKTWLEAMDMQAEFARDRLEAVASESAKFGEISLLVANQALEPIQSRIEAGAEKLFQPFA